MGRQSGWKHGAFDLLLALVLASAVLSAGCTTVHYVFQAAKGQLAISNRARPIESVLKDERTPKKVRETLSEVSQVKAFGESRGIRPTSNYSEYVRLDRPAVVWVVSACEKLAFQPKSWSFPIAGSFTYLGWFDREDAEGYASEVRKENVDVDLRGASAYSTLGWFRDPILSSMIPRGDHYMGSLVNVVLHESVHATLYIDDQSYFNESLASFIADRMTFDYLRNRFGGASPHYRAYEEASKRFERHRKLMRQAYLDLESLYSSSKGSEEKLQKKEVILSELEKATQSRRAMNNATLIQYRTYGIGATEFEALLGACENDWQRFLSSLSKLDESSFPKVHTEDLQSVLSPLISGGCAGA